MKIVCSCNSYKKNTLLADILLSMEAKQGFRKQIHALNEIIGALGLLVLSILPVPLLQRAQPGFD